MTLALMRKDLWTNKAECLRLRGTPGEPVPVFKPTVVQVIAWTNLAEQGELVATVDGWAWLIKRDSRNSN